MTFQLGDSIFRVIGYEVIYADVPPWPEAVDGTGESLQRVSASRIFQEIIRITGCLLLPHPAKHRKFTIYPSVFTKRH